MKEYLTYSPRTEDQYLEQRVADQIEWFDKKSLKNKRWFLSLRIIEIIFSLFIPFLSGYSTNPQDNRLKITIGLLGILVAFIAGIITLVKFQENWIGYRTAAESLKLEKFLFLAKTGPYKDASHPFLLFVERFESLIANTTKKWESVISRSQREQDRPH